MKVNNALDLDRAIALLEQKEKEQKKDVSKQLSDVGKSVQPARLVKNMLFGSGGNHTHSTENSGFLGVLGKITGGVTKPGTFTKTLSSIGISLLTKKLLNRPNANGVAVNGAGTIAPLVTSGLGIIGTFLNRGPKDGSSGKKPVLTDDTRKGLIISVLTAGVGILASQLFDKRGAKSNKFSNKMIKTGFSTILLANVDRIAAFIMAIFKTNFGNKTPQEV